MGMTIDEKCYLYGSCKCQTAGCVVPPDNGCPVYRYFKDLILKDYETRLKADMVAMLTELQLEIEEKFNDRPFSYNHHQRTEFYRDIDEIIQEKINSLKED
jgi:hypothetical protein